MLFMDVPGDGTVDLGCAQVSDPRTPAPVSGFEEVAQLRFTPRAGGPRALHDHRHSVAGGVHLAWIGQITTHDFNRQSPDPRGTGPLSHAGAHLSAPGAVQNFRYPPADESPGPGYEHPVIRGHSGSAPRRDRKSTRLNSSHVAISYAVFCLKKK